MTKPKIVNNCFNPLLRLEKRLEEYKKHHNESAANCIKIQESHNKTNLELKASLERKSKISESKVKKKRSSNGTTVNRKKSKIVNEKIQSKQFFEDCLEATPNVSLNVNSSEFPDIDLDTLDLLKDPNFSMSINEQELDGVLNNCCSQQTLNNDLYPNQISSELIYTYNSSNQPKSEPVTSNMNVINFKMEENTQTPLFPPPEIPLSSRLHSNLNANYPSSLNYIGPNITNPNYASNVVPVTTHPIMKAEDVKFNPIMYPTNVHLNNSISNQNPGTYNYHYNSNNTTNNNLSQMIPDLPGNNSQQYFYQYGSFPSATNYADLSSNNPNSFQLPTMSSGWYNNPPNQIVKQQSNCKPPSQIPQQQQFIGIPTTSSNYHSNFSLYQMDSHGANTHPSLQCQQIFSNPYDNSFNPTNHPSYNILTQPTMTSYNMISDQNSYYYTDYSSVTNRSNGTSNSNLGMINQPPDTQFISSSHNNSNICRNVYQSHCI